MHIFARTILTAGFVSIAVAASAEVYFEDGFDGDALSSDWTIENPDPEAYLVDSGVLTLLVPDRTAAYYGEAINTLVLNKPVPKGDWTMTVRLVLTPQTMGEKFVIGVAKDPATGLYAVLSLETPNYDNTDVYVTGKKLSGGTQTQFYRKLYTISGRDIEGRGSVFPANIAAVNLQLEKKKHKYIARMLLEPVSPLSDGAPDGKWRDVQNLTALRSAGDKFVLSFGSWSSDYLPADGEALIEVDFVRIETP
jgi:hypothetical protein